MSKTWFTADTHFGHANVIKYDDRPFADLTEMEDEIIKRWNKKVKNGDTVWFLGDFAFSNKLDYIKPILKRLNGQKYMVMGNHDTKSPQFYRDCGFIEVYNHPVILKDFFILSHRPMFITENMPYFNIYGHVHNHSAFLDKTLNSCCVCCCRWNYEPIQIEEFDGLNGSVITTKQLYDALNDGGKWTVESIYNNEEKFVDNIVEVIFNNGTLVVNMEDTDRFITATGERIRDDNGVFIVDYNNGERLVIRYGKN